ncbi:hypothetical protein [Arthrobacter luteolus]|nr:hypothetical protein [Arthrobacter luteolus]
MTIWPPLHDRHLEPPDDIDRDALDAESNTQYEDDADTWRKGE